MCNICIKHVCKREDILFTKPFFDRIKKYLSRSLDRRLGLWGCPGLDGDNTQHSSLPCRSDQNWVQPALHSSQRQSLCRQFQFQHFQPGQHHERLRHVGHRQRVSLLGRLVWSGRQQVHCHRLRWVASWANSVQLGYFFFICPKVYSCIAPTPGW